MGLLELLILPRKLGSLRFKRKWRWVVGKRECVVGIRAEILSIRFVVRMAHAQVIVVWCVIPLIGVFVLGRKSPATMGIVVGIMPIAPVWLVHWFSDRLFWSVLGLLLGFGWKVSWAR